MYDGRFFVVPQDVVLRDVETLVSEGVRHLTFADPDFFNGPRHSLRVVDAIHERFPDLTFDLTTKVEHVLKHRDLFPRLAEQGCLFVVSAVESLSDRVLTELDKGHTRQDVLDAVAVLRDTGISLRPSLVAFTPWTELADYLDVLDWIDEFELVDQVDPVQLSIRLLVPPGSLLAARESMRRHVTELDPAGFCWRWTHPDPRMDRLHAQVAALVQDAALHEEDAAVTYGRIRDAALRAAGRSDSPPVRISLPALERRRPPRLTEPWFC